MKKRKSNWPSVSGKNKGEKVLKVLAVSKSVSTAMLVSRQMTEIARLKRELSEHKRLFEMQHERSRHAEILWREHTGNPNVTPDLGALLDWLIERGNRWQDVIKVVRDINVNAASYLRLLPDDDQTKQRWQRLNKAIRIHDMFYEGVKL